MENNKEQIKNEIVYNEIPKLAIRLGSMGEVEITMPTCAEPELAYMYRMLDGL